MNRVQATFPVRPARDLSAAPAEQMILWALPVVGGPEAAEEEVLPARAAVAVAVEAAAPA